MAQGVRRGLGGGAGAVCGLQPGGEGALALPGPGHQHRGPGDTGGHPGELRDTV